MSSSMTGGAYSGAAHTVSALPPSLLLIGRVTGEVRSSRDWDKIMGGQLERPMDWSGVSCAAPWDGEPQETAHVFDTQVIARQTVPVPMNRGASPPDIERRVPTHYVPRPNYGESSTTLKQEPWLEEMAQRTIHHLDDGSSTVTHEVVPMSKADRVPWSHLQTHIKMKKTPQAAADHQARPHRCHVCPSSFMKKHHLQAHLLTHSDMRPFVCETCGKSYRLRQHLTRHQQQHFGIRPYTCNECGMTFGLREHLKRHQTVRHHQWKSAKEEEHEREEEEEAGPAPLTYQPPERHFKGEMREMPSAVSHVERVLHPSQEVMVIKPVAASDERAGNGLRCSMCELSFCDAVQLAVHERSHNPGSEFYSCPHCSREFRRIDNLIRHIEVHKQRSEFSCSVCGRVFGRRDNLIRHQRSTCRYLNPANQHLVHEVH